VCSPQIHPVIRPCAGHIIRGLPYTVIHGLFFKNTLVLENSLAGDTEFVAGCTFDVAHILEENQASGNRLAGDICEFLFQSLLGYLCRGIPGSHGVDLLENDIAILR
jgi:hypothetical protein